MEKKYVWNFLFSIMFLNILINITTIYKTMFTAKITFSCVCNDIILSSSFNEKFFKIWK